MPIPPFDPATGYLPPGIHLVAWPEVVERVARTDRRRWLLGGIEAAAANLKAAGCRWLYLAGSFVTDKPDPADFDGCWDMAGVNLLVVDPTLCDFDPPRRARKRKYRGEFLPVDSS